MHSELVQWLQIILPMQIKIVQGPLKLLCSITKMTTSHVVTQHKVNGDEIPNTYWHDWGTMMLKVPFVHHLIVQALLGSILVPFSKRASPQSDVIMRAKLRRSGVGKLSCMRKWAPTNSGNLICGFQYQFAMS